MSGPVCNINYRTIYNNHFDYLQGMSQNKTKLMAVISEKYFAHQNSKEFLNEHAKKRLEKGAVTQ